MKPILIVDDEAPIRALIRLTLERAGYTCDEAATGTEAADKIEANTYDLALLDIMLPKLDGFQVARRLRAERVSTPILMLTARDDVSDKISGLDCGADDYMTKPIDEEEMLWRIKALLRRAKIASERRIVVGDVVLDYDCLTVSRKGEVQELPQKEFLLLYKLLSYPGKIFTRIQLMDEIWGADSDTGWETVTVHVGRLRKRFQDWPEFTIESVRGLGYKAVKKV